MWPLITFEPLDVRKRCYILNLFLSLFQHIQTTPQFFLLPRGLVVNFAVAQTCRDAQNQSLHDMLPGLPQIPHPTASIGGEMGRTSSNKKTCRKIIIGIHRYKTYGAHMDIHYHIWELISSMVSAEEVLGSPTGRIPGAPRHWAFQSGGQTSAIFFDGDLWRKNNPEFCFVISSLYVDNLVVEPTRNGENNGNIMGI